MKSWSTFDKNLPRCKEYRGAFEKSFQNIANIEKKGLLKIQYGGMRKLSGSIPKIV